MCGILGVASKSSVAPHHLILARDKLAHRGPDDAGLWWAPQSANRLGLAQRRLSIIDCSPAGHQPMLDERGELSIVFNGEIYNFVELRRELEQLGHRFRTRSDTEVLLEAYRAWGVDCPRRLNGMFAFCIYDPHARRLFFARDRAGEKPLFYWHSAGQLAFASELKALMELPGFPRRLNLEALEHYLAFGFVPGQMCLLDGVRKLPQGHAMTFDVDADWLNVWRYWQLPAADPSPSRGDDELLSELERLLEDSVSRQLVADVPVGVLLSGGIDSSLVTAMAARVSSCPVKTFTVSFPGHAGYDEAPFARQVARHFGTEHVELIAEPGSVELLPQLARQYDEPMADSSMVPTYLVSKAIREHCTVALGGDGGDELFGGYHQHVWIQQVARRQRFVPGPLRNVLRQAAGRWLPLGLRGRNYLLSLLSDVPHGVAQFNVYFDAPNRDRLLAPLRASRPVTTVSPEDYKADLSRAFASPLLKSTGVDFMTYLVDDILVKVDRASMLASLEVRAPWLDCRLIEFAFRDVPDRLKATTRERKILPRRLAVKLLPSDMDLRRKQGFSLPLAKWFRGDWGRFVADVLAEADPGIFSQAAIRSLLDGQRYGRSNTQRLFSLTMFELWRREYDVRL